MRFLASCTATSSGPGKLQRRICLRSDYSAKKHKAANCPDLDSKTHTNISQVAAFVRRIFSAKAVAAQLRRDRPLGTLFTGQKLTTIVELKSHVLTSNPTDNFLRLPLIMAVAVT